MADLTIGCVGSSVHRVSARILAGHSDWQCGVVSWRRGGPRQGNDAAQQPRRQK